MPRFDRDALIDRALDALNDAAEASLKGPITPDKSLTFVFAFLHAELSDKKVLPELWKEMQLPLAGLAYLDFGRVQTINNLAGYIHRLVEREPPGN